MAPHLRLHQPDHQPDAAPFNNPKIRNAMALAIDRKTIIDILSQGKSDMSGVMLPRPRAYGACRRRCWGSCPATAATSRRAAPRRARSWRASATGRDKPLKVKVSTRNIPIYRDPGGAAHRPAQEDLHRGRAGGDRHQHLARQGDAQGIRVGLNLTGIGVDDPDVKLYENYTCNSERNLTQYCNKEVDALIDKQSQEPDREKRKKIVWEIERKLAEDLARPIIYYDRAATCWQPQRQGLRRCTTTASTTTGASRTCGWTSKRGRRSGKEAIECRSLHRSAGCS